MAEAIKKTGLSWPTLVGAQQPEEATGVSLPTCPRKSRERPQPGEIQCWGLQPPCMSIGLGPPPHLSKQASCSIEQEQK